MKLPAPKGYTEMRAAIEGEGRQRFAAAWDGTEFAARENMLSIEEARAEMVKRAAEREATKRREVEREARIARGDPLPAFRVNGAYRPQSGDIRRNVTAPPLRDDEDPTSADYQAERSARVRFEEAATSLRQQLLDGDRTAIGRAPMRPPEAFPADFWIQDEAADVLELGTWFDGERDHPVYVSVAKPVANQDGAPAKTDWEASMISHQTNARGRRPVKLEAVKAAMIAHANMPDLAAMTEETMAAMFDASRDTCRKARNLVLSEMTSE